MDTNDTFSCLARNPYTTYSRLPVTKGVTSPNLETRMYLKGCSVGET